MAEGGGPTSSPIDRLLAVARGELGTTEFPPGTNLQKYGAWYGDNGVPWCDIWVSYVSDRAGLGQDIWKSESVPQRLARARQLGEVRLVPAPGALACYDWGGDGIPDHIGIVETVTGPFAFTAIEGNTSPDDGGSQSNGGGVYRRHRVTQQVVGFIYPQIIEDHMPLTQTDIDAVALAVLQRFAGWKPPTGEDINWQTVVSRTYSNSQRVLSADAIASALVKVLPQGSGLDPHALAQAVVDDIAGRLSPGHSA